MSVYAFKAEEESEGEPGNSGCLILKAMTFNLQLRFQQNLKLV